MEKGRLAVLRPSAFVFVMLQHFFCDIATYAVSCCKKVKLNLKHHF